MAPQDYVKRGQPKKRKAKPSTKKKKRKTTTPWIRVVGAFVVVAVFLSGLGWLQFSQNDTMPTQNVEPIVTDKQADNPTQLPAQRPNDKERLPVLEEEEWAFIDALPEYSVEVDVEEMPESDKTYIMQCGSFRQMGQADELKAKIAFQGFSSDVAETNGSNGRWFRVVLGPYERKRQAEKDRHQLRRANILGCKIW